MLYHMLFQILDTLTINMNWNVTVSYSMLGRGDIYSKYMLVLDILWYINSYGLFNDKLGVMVKALDSRIIVPINMTLAMSFFFING